MLALVAFLAIAAPQKPSDDIAKAKAYINAEFASHIKAFKTNNGVAAANFWVKNCLAGYVQYDTAGASHGYDEVVNAFITRPNTFDSSPERTMKLLKIEKVKDGYATLVDQGWVGILRNSPDGSSNPKVTSRAIVQQIWQKTRKGYGLKFAESLYSRVTAPDSGTNERNMHPHKIWNGKEPEVPKALINAFANLPTTRLVRDPRRRPIPPRQS